MKFGILLVAFLGYIHAAYGYFPYLRNNGYSNCGNGLGPYGFGYNYGLNVLSDVAGAFGFGGRPGCYHRNSNYDDRYVQQLRREVELQRLRRLYELNSRRNGGLFGRGGYCGNDRFDYDGGYGIGFDDGDDGNGSTGNGGGDGSQGLSDDKDNKGDSSNQAPAPSY